MKFSKKPYLILAIATAVLTMAGLVVWGSRSARLVGPTQAGTQAEVATPTASVSDKELEAEPLRPGPDSCQGNRGEICIGVPSVDLWPTGSEDASNPELSTNSNDSMKNIEGRIQSIDGKQIVIKSSSGRLFTINFPIDAVAHFNTTRSRHYNNIKVAKNDMLFVTYFEPSSKKSLDIPVTKLQGADLLIKVGQGPLGAVEKF